MRTPTTAAGLLGNLLGKRGPARAERSERTKEPAARKKRGPESFDVQLAGLQQAAPQRPALKVELADKTPLAATNTTKTKPATLERTPPQLPNTDTPSSPLQPSPMVAFAAPPPTTDPTQTIDAAPSVPAHEPAHALMQAALDDRTLHIDASATLVRVGLETQTAGALSLEVRVHEGRAEIHAEGPASPLVAAHAPELREALGHQGLSLGNFSHGQRSADERREEREHPTTPGAAKQPTTSSVNRSTRAPRHGGGIDVEA